MSDELILNVTGHEARIALISDGRVAEITVERPRRKSMVGNIYLGRVARVLPGMPRRRSSRLAWGAMPFCMPMTPALWFWAQ